MNPFDESPLPPREPGSGAQKPSSSENPVPGSEPLVSEPFAAVETQVAETIPVLPTLPEDLRITWSWVHFLVFIFFTLINLVAVPGFFLARYGPHERMSAQQLEQYMMSKPQIAIGTTLALYAVMLFFLYVTLALLRGQPFWRSLGWRRLQAGNGGQAGNSWLFFFTGCGLSLFVAMLSYVAKPPENTPIEQVFKYKQTAMLFVAMAVLVAPLAEETIFRGYLYPMFARWFGIVPSVVLTGVLFGLMHGPQLGGTPALVALLIIVGIVFTWARARTGTVFASYLMHLGYNSLIAASIVWGTHGFTQLPTNH